MHVKWDVFIIEPYIYIYISFFSHPYINLGTLESDHNRQFTLEILNIVGAHKSCTMSWTLYEFQHM